MLQLRTSSSFIVARKLRFRSRPWALVKLGVTPRATSAASLPHFFHELAMKKRSCLIATRLGVRFFHQSFRSIVHSRNLLSLRRRHSPGCGIVAQRDSFIWAPGARAQRASPIRHQQVQEQMSATQPPTICVVQTANWATRCCASSVIALAMETFSLQHPWGDRTERRYLRSPIVWTTV